MRPLLRSLLLSLLLLTWIPINLVHPEFAERERIGMDVRLGVLSPVNEEVGTGLGYGGHLLFVMPGRFQGELGVDFFSSSSQEPLTEVRVPGWRLREASSRVDLIPITIGGTYTITSGRFRPYLGMAMGWLVLNEHIEAVFVDTGYILTTRKSFGGGGPEGELALGLRYIVTPRVAVFTEITCLGAWVDYRGEKLRLLGPALSAGMRF